MKKHLISGIFAAVLVCSCATNPITGKQNLNFVSNSELFPSSFQQYSQFLTENKVITGTADAKRVETAFRIILKDPNVKAILINIFGGIVRCDRVAQGVVDAYQNMGDDIKVPIIVRLQGTNAEEGAKIIEQSGLKVFSAILLKDAAQRVKEVLR